MSQDQPFAVVPNQLQSYYHDWKMSPGIVSNGHMFFTGFTGADQNGELPQDFEAQIRNVFEKIELVLHKANLGFSHIVEMTSYHVGIQTHLELFKSIRSEYVVEPYPAWTAIEVSGFVRKDAIVEVKAVARIS